MILRLSCAALAAAALMGSTSRAEEPNESFAAATLLPPGVLTVSDLLTPGAGNEPDTLLGVSVLGDIDFIDDNGSTLGNGLASGAFDVPIPFGTIEFAVTGYGNFDFNSLHDESGMYEVIVDVYDENGVFAGQHSEVRTLAVDAVDEFTFSDAGWVNGMYDVNINNVVPQGGDVDFFRFTGLTAGATFVAETLADELSSIDTVLGWFDSGGTLIQFDDDGADGTLSRIAGVVPAGGALTFAVSGFGDDEFSGVHFQNDAYQLELTLGGGGTLTADFDNSGGVRAADLALWRGAFGPSAVGDADDDNDTDGADFLAWQRQLGSGAGAASSVPEPASTGLLGLALLSCGVALRRR
jgi:hypothetical protein